MVLNGTGECGSLLQAVLLPFDILMLILAQVGDENERQSFLLIFTSK